MKLLLEFVLRVHMQEQRASKSFHEKAIVGIQSASGYAEGRPLHTSW